MLAAATKQPDDPPKSSLHKDLLELDVVTGHSGHHTSQKPGKHHSRRWLPGSTAPALASPAPTMAATPGICTMPGQAGSTQLWPLSLPHSAPGKEHADASPALAAKNEPTLGLTQETWSMVAQSVGAHGPTQNTCCCTRSQSSMIRSACVQHAAEPTDKSSKNANSNKGQQG